MRPYLSVDRGSLGQLQCVIFGGAKKKEDGMRQVQYTGAKCFMGAKLERVQNSAPKLRIRKLFHSPREQQEVQRSFFRYNG